MKQNTVIDLPSLKNYVSYIYPMQLSSDLSIIIILKQLYRGDDVLIDIYLNEISETTKIIAGRKLSEDSIVCHPRYDIGFNYVVYCTDIKGINNNLTKYNVNQFYLQFERQE